MKRVLYAAVYVYLPAYLRTLVYMLQSTEYHAWPYLKWFWHTNDFSRVMYRRTLEPTRPAQLLRIYLNVGIMLEVLVGLGLIAFGVRAVRHEWIYFGVALIAVYPVLWAHLLVLPLWLGEKLLIAPKRRLMIHGAERIFAKHPGKKIAIVGSYGKTSMKELLATVLGEGLKVAATPANKNVAVSQAYFAHELAGDEDVLIIEYGEGAPGDIGRFAKLTHPTHAVITGLAPAHLDQYKTLEASGRDIFSIAGFVDPASVYVNQESPSAQPFLRKEFKTYSAAGALGWKISNVHVGFDGTKFTFKKGQVSMKLHSQLLGRHHLGPLAFAAAFAYEQGMSQDQIKAGISKTKPYEHRMQPYPLAGGWVVDDTYNGNIEGIRVGLELLAELPARRKIYVTPGLVDQGRETRSVHEEMGRLIAAASPDVVVLMQNSTTPYIAVGLTANGYQGDLRIESDPLAFYQNLDQFLAAGDVALLQNDWPDNYH